jgi:hypothetical protein
LHAPTQTHYGGNAITLLMGCTFMAFTLRRASLEISSQHKFIVDNLILIKIATPTGVPAMKVA